MKKYPYMIGFIGLISISFIKPTLAQFRPDRPTFFEDGQNLMEQEIRRLEQQKNQPVQNQQILEHPSQLLTIDDGKLKWQKYLFQVAGFSVWMPQGVQSDERVTIPTQAGEIEFDVFATHPKSLRFIAASSDDQKLTKLGNSSAILTAIKEGIITKTNFKLVEEKTINVNSNNGLLLKMKQENETIYFQILLVNKKAYVLAVGTKNTGYEEDITNFFNSFRLLP